MLKRIVPLLIGLIVLGGFGWTLWFLYQKSRTVPVVYETEKPFVTDVVKKTVAPGAIIPRKEIAIKPRISGVIEKLYIDPGDYVKQNQLLAKIKIIPNMVTLNTAESSVQSAEIGFTNAEKERERFQKLFSQGVITQTELNKYTLDFDLKQQEVTAAKNNLQLIKEGASKGSGKISNEVFTTVEGMVTEVPVKEGGSVIETNNFNEGTTIASVADMNDMIFRGYVDESEIGRIHENMPVDITIGALSGSKYKGKLEYIAPKGMDKEGTIQFEVRAALQLPDKHTDGNFVRANYSANADIILDRRDKVLAISESLVKFEGGKPYVEIEVGPQKFEKRFVDLGLSDGINVELKSGVDKDAKIKKARPEGDDATRRKH